MSVGERRRKKRGCWDGGMCAMDDCAACSYREERGEEKGGGTGHGTAAACCAMTSSAEVILQELTSALRRKYVPAGVEVKVEFVSGGKSGRCCRSDGMRCGGKMRQSFGLAPVATSSALGGLPVGHAVSRGLGGLGP